MPSLTKQEIASYLTSPIDPAEDDIGDDDYDEESTPNAGSKKLSKPRTAKKAANSARLATSQVTSRVGDLGRISNLAETGSFLSPASGGVSGALAPVTAITGPIGLALGLLSAGFSAWSAHKTAAHIRKLEAIVRAAYDSGGNPKTIQAILFVCKKKNKKLRRKGVGSIPILGSVCNTIYTVGRSVKKRAQGTKGIERRAQAKTLWRAACAGDKYAEKACRELLGDKTYDLIAGLDDGDIVLKKKIRSL